MSKDQAPVSLNGWFERLDKREQVQIEHARDYAKFHSFAGVPGHGQFILISKLADLLDGHSAPVDELG